MFTATIGSRLSGARITSSPLSRRYFVKGIVGGAATSVFAAYAGTVNDRSRRAVRNFMDEKGRARVGEPAPREKVPIKDDRCALPTRADRTDENDACRLPSAIDRARLRSGLGDPPHAA